MLRPALQPVSIRKYSRLPTRRPDHPPILPHSYQRMAKGGAPQHNTSARGAAQQPRNRSNRHKRASALEYTYHGKYALYVKEANYHGTCLLGPRPLPSNLRG